MNLNKLSYLTLAISITLTGCSVFQSGSNDAKAVAVEPAPDAGFIQQPGRQTVHKDLPFQKVWIKPGFNAAKYKEIIVSPVNTDYMLKMDWLHSITAADVIGDVKKDTAELALYFHNQIIKNFEEDPKHRFTVIKYASQLKNPALQLEIALIEIDPSASVLHALSWAGPIGTGSAVGAVNQRRAAFEARLRDKQTGEVVATFADRDMQDVGPIDLTRLTWYGPAKGIMDRWAHQFVQIANRKPGEIISDPTAFTVRPF